jgi:hypothetical protein
MAITSADGALAGMQQPREFIKALTGTMVAGRWHSLWYVGGIPPANPIPTNIVITSNSIANPTVVLTASAHGMVTGDQVSISGVITSVPALDGFYTVTYVDATHFSVPVNVTTAGTGGVCFCYNKGAGAGTAGLVGKVLTTGMAGSLTSGQLPFTNPVAGFSYNARLQGQATIAGSLLLCDRLWENSGISPIKATEQVFTGSAQIPARDQDGTNVGTGVYAGVEVAVATGASAPTFTVKYTNTLGTAGKTGTNIVANVASSIAGTFYPIGLAAGDLGIQKAESITLSATQTSGTIQVVLYRILARLELTAANVPNAIDALTGGFPRLYDDVVPFLIFIPSAVTSSNITGHAIWSQG